MRPFRVIATVLVAMLVVSVVPAQAAAPATRYANTAHAATNQERTARDLAPLRKNACLKRFATKQAARMANQRRIFHQDLGPILRRCGLSTVGENVAYGYRTGRAVVRQGWMKSPGHRENILRPQFRLMGIGAKKAGGVWYTAQVFGRK